MTFYIIAGSSPTVICSTSEAEFTTDNLDQALDRFMSNEVITNKRFNYAYLLVDFEIQKNGILDGPSEIHPENKVLPFLILGEYNKFKGHKSISKDTIILKTPGFEEEFSDNIAALRKFIELYESNSICTMSMRYVYTNKKEKKIEINEPVIVSTTHLHDAKQFYKKARICISPMVLNPYPLIKERNFSKEEYNEIVKGVEH